MDGKVCSSGEGGTEGKDLPVCTCMCGSVHDCRCVVDGSGVMAASLLLESGHGPINWCTLSIASC